MAGITVMAINALIAKAQRDNNVQYLTDGTVPGLAVNASKRGNASWYLRYWFNGKQKEITIGRYPAWSVSEARAKAKELRMAIKDGVDVAVEKRARKAEATIEKRDKALSDAMFCQVSDWLSTWWNAASDSDRRELFNHWQRTISTCSGASKWPG